MIESGSRMGYYVNESKSWLILKDSNKLEEAKRIFNATSIQYTTEGKRHLGATIGSDDFRTAYATQKVTEWCDELERFPHLQSLNHKQRSLLLSMENIIVLTSF